MKKRFAYTQKKWILILSGIAMILALLSVIFNILRLCEVGEFVSFNHPLDIMATVVVIIVSAILLVFVVGSSYILTKKSLVVNIGFFVKIIKFQDIKLVRENNEKTMLFVYFKAGKSAMIENNDGFRANLLQVNIESKYFDNFVDGLKKANRDIVYEIFGDDKEKNDEGNSRK